MSQSRSADLSQLLFIELEEDHWSAALEKRLRALRPGGLLLSHRILGSPASTAELLAKCARTLDAALFLAFEDEGSEFGPLGKGFPALPSVSAVSEKGADASQHFGNFAGAALNLLGFNACFAPQLDFASAPAETPSNPAGIAKDATRGADCGVAIVQALQKHSIMACPRYFPGFGDAEADPDSGYLVSGKPMARMWREDLLPYRAVLPRVQLAMVSYIAYKAYDLNAAIPAALSINVLQGLLRVKLGYRGLALADYYGAAKAMLGTFKPSAPRSISIGFEAFPKSILAGIDMLVVKGGMEFSDLLRQQLVNAVEAGTLSEQRVDDALKRIARVKKRIRVPTGKFSSRKLDQLCRGFEKFKKNYRDVEKEIA